jgi:hypothetical protein
MKGDIFEIYIKGALNSVVGNGRRKKAEQINWLWKLFLGWGLRKERGEIGIGGAFNLPHATHHTIFLYLFLLGSLCIGK